MKFTTHVTVDQNTYMMKVLEINKSPSWQIKDRNKDYEGALKDYVKALGIDDEAVAGPGLGTIILNYKFKSSSVRERALYLNEQLQLPEDERVLSIEELDAGQVMHKPGKL